MDKKIILKRIDELMKEKGITNYQLKENADISSTIYQWRKNAKRDEARTPSLRSIEKICVYFGVSLSYFLSFNEEQQKDIKDKELYKRICRLSYDQVNILNDLIDQLK